MINREEGTPFGCMQGGVPCQPVKPEPALCYSANVLTFGSGESVLGTQLVHVSENSSSVIRPLSTSFNYNSGQLRIDLTSSVNGSNAAHPPLTAANGPVLYGLPAFGFLAMRYINANVTPGVLANYSGDYPHRSRVSCTNSTNPQNTCQ
jgi:hypothetical protein